MKSYQTFMCFLHIRCSQLFVLLFLIEYLISREWDYLAPNIGVRVRFWVRVRIGDRVRVRVRVGV